MALYKYKLLADMHFFLLFTRLEQINWTTEKHCISVPITLYDSLLSVRLLEPGHFEYYPNHNWFWKQKILKFYCKWTDNIHEFEGSFLGGQVSSNGFSLQRLHSWTLYFIGPFAKKLENFLFSKNVVIGYSSPKCSGLNSHTVSRCS